MTEKQIFEAEVVDELEDKFKKFTKKKTADAGEQINSIKKAILFKGISSLILPFSIFIFVVVGIIFIIMVIFDRPFDYIFSGIFLFLILSPIYKLIKMFK